MSSSLFGWYRTHGNTTKEHHVDIQAGFARGQGRHETYGFLLITRDDGAKIQVRIPPYDFARLAAQMASAHLAADPEDAQTT